MTTETELPEVVSGERMPDLKPGQSAKRGVMLFAPDEPEDLGPGIIQAVLKDGWYVYQGLGDGQERVGFVADGTPIEKVSE